MPQNALFGLLNLYGAELSESVHKIATLAQGTDRYKSPYFHFDLRQLSPIEMANQPVSADHLSIYRETANHRLYHYTAYIGGNTARVYFNKKGDVSFVTLKNEAEIALPLPLALREQLITLAHERCDTLMQIVNKTLTERIQALETTKTEINTVAETLSTAIASDPTTYITTLEQLCDVYTSIGQLVTDLFYQSMIRSLRQMIAQTQQIVVNPTASSASPAMTASAATTEEDAPVSASPVPQTRELIDEEILTLQAAFDELKPKRNLMDKNAYATAIAKLFEDSNQLFFKSSEQTYTASFKAMNQLSALNQAITSEGETILGRSCKNNLLEVVKVLHPFYSAFNVQHVGYALEHGSHELLQIILDNSKLASDEIIGHIAVQHCFKPTAKESWRCLAVLIAHNVSLHILDEQGLPIARTLYGSNAHLMQALTHNKTNKRNTVNSFDFYHHLLSMLQNIDSLHLTPTDSKEITQVIRICEIEIERLKSLSILPKASIPGLKNMEKTVAALAEVPLMAQLKSKIAADPEIQKIVAEWNARLASRKQDAKKSRSQIKTATSIVQITIDLLSENDFNTAFISYRRFKQFIINYLKRQIEEDNYNLELAHLPLKGKFKEKQELLSKIAKLKSDGVEDLVDFACMSKEGLPTYAAKEFHTLVQQLHEFNHAQQIKHVSTHKPFVPNAGLDNLFFAIEYKATRESFQDFTQYLPTLAQAIAECLQDGDVALLLKYMESDPDFATSVKSDKAFLKDMETVGKQLTDVIGLVNKYVTLMIKVNSEFNQVGTLLQICLGTIKTECLKIINLFTTDTKDTLLQAAKTAIPQITQDESEATNDSDQAEASAQTTSRVGLSSFFPPARASSLTPAPVSSRHSAVNS